MPLADVTVHVFDFNSLGFCGNELNFFDITDMLAPVPNSAASCIAELQWDILHYLLLKKLH